MTIMYHCCNIIEAKKKKTLKIYLPKKSSNIDIKSEIYMKHCAANKLDERNKNAIEGLL